MESCFLADDELDSLIWYSDWPYGNPGEEALQCGRLRTVLPPLTETDHQSVCTRSMIDSADNTARHSAYGAPPYQDFLKEPSPDDSTVPDNTPLPSAFFPDTTHSVPLLSDYIWRSRQREIHQMADGEDPLRTSFGDWPPFATTDGERTPGFAEDIPLTLGFEHVSTRDYDDPRIYASDSTERGVPPRRRGSVKEQSKRTKQSKRPSVSKGVTMYLRTLLRQLLAGTGWIMDSSISKAKATKLIKRLLGSDLAHLIQVELPTNDAGTLPQDTRDNHYQRILAEIMTCVLQRPVTQSETERFITRDKGPYRLASVFVNMLHHKQWPPYLPSESELRYYGCYREGEGSMKVKIDYV